jgi:flagellin-like hook-associated protein FlgL
MSDVSLTGGMRSNLLTLQQTATLMTITQQRLATGKKVNSALDDAAKFFSSQAHMSRSDDLDRLKAGMGESIQTVKSADQGITGVLKLLEQARGLADSARSSATPATLADQFNKLVDQMKTLVEDAGYKGTNLLNNQNLSTQFEGTHNLATTGINASGDANYLGGLNNAVSNANGGYNSFGTEADITNAIDDLNSVIDNFRAAASTLAANVSVITTRQDFTSGMIDTLRTGATNLVAADSNEEGANMLMLQTRQQLGTVSLQLASQAAQSILRLF